MRKPRLHHHVTSKPCKQESKQERDKLSTPNTSRSHLRSDLPTAPGRQPYALLPGHELLLHLAYLLCIATSACIYIYMNVICIYVYMCACYVCTDPYRLCVGMSMAHHVLDILGTDVYVRICICVCVYICGMLYILHSKTGPASSTGHPCPARA